MIVTERATHYATEYEEVHGVSYLAILLKEHGGTIVLAAYTRSHGFACLSDTFCGQPALPPYRFWKVLCSLR